MEINSLQVENFRNLKTQKIDFSPGLNVLYGDNAQGKTNTLEAIYFTTIGRSPRTRRDQECINFNQKHAQLKITFSRTRVRQTLSATLEPAGKGFFLDDNKLAKLSDVVGNFGSVYFSPDELELIQGGPARRRRFVDIINCQLKKEYLKNLQTFQRLINQRNHLLKARPPKLSEQLPVWDEQLAEVGAKLFSDRFRFITVLERIANEKQAMLSSQKENLTVAYESFSQTDLPYTELRDLYLTGLKKALERDLALGYTTFGVHNDDFLIKVNGQDLRKTGSQGQQRTATLALKLAELEILKEEYGSYPVLLLDDVLSELDSTRQQKLLGLFDEIQCIMTCTHLDFERPCTRFLVRDGEIKLENKRTQKDDRKKL